MTTSTSPAVRMTPGRGRGLGSSLVGVPVGLVLLSSLLFLQLVAVSSQSCVHGAGVMSYFSFSATFLGYTTYPDETFTLQLGALFQSGDSPTSANAVFLLTTVSGSVSRSDYGHSVSVTTVVAPTSEISNDNLLYPYTTTGGQIDAYGITVTDSQNNEYRINLDSFGYYKVNDGPQDHTYFDRFITNTDCPYIPPTQAPAQFVTSSSSSLHSSSHISSSTFSSSAHRSSSHSPSSSHFSSSHFSSSKLSSSTFSSSTVPSSSKAPSSSVISSSVISSSQAPSSSAVSSSSSSSGNGAVYSDPFFFGFWRQTFYVHGVSGGVYSIISDEYVQLNARLTFLSNVTCPEVNETAPAVHCSSHPGTYCGSFALTTSNGDCLLITADGVAVGFGSVVWNGVVVKVGDSDGTVDSHHLSHSHRDPLTGINSASSHAPRPDLFVHRSSFRSLTVHVGLYEMLIDNADHYLDLVQVTIANWTTLTEVQPEGLLGRTWNAAVPMPPMEEQYREKDGDLTGCNFEVEVNKFCHGRQMSTAVGEDGKGRDVVVEELSRRS